MVTVHGEATKFLWAALNRVFRYIAGTLSTGTIYTAVGDKAITLSRLYDSDCAGFKIDRKSTTGFVFLLFQSDQCHGSRCSLFNG